jgi:hypothetical protein
VTEARVVANSLSDVMIPMFVSPRANLIESSDGFSVEVLGRTGLRYSEVGRDMFIDSEMLLAPSGMLVYKGTIQKWDPPNEDVAVSESDRERILGNIKEAFRFQGFEIAVM